MEKFVIIIGTAVIVIAITGVLKICNLLYMNHEKKRRMEARSDFKLLSENVSYKKYKKIAQRSSVPNKPIRTTGDFLDFILRLENESGSASQLIENNLFKSNCGVVDDE